MMVYYTIVTLIFVVLYFFYYHLTKNYDYWRKRNVPCRKPSLLFGNYKEYILLRKYMAKVAQEICQNYPDEPYVGVFYGTDPALIIKDPNLIKLVMTKDYYYFNYREVSQHTHKELITKNMFFSGGDTWKVLRQNLTPLFSSAKMKNMFYLVESCASCLETALSRELCQKNTIEMKSLLAKYTMDCIGSCVFGINTGTLTNEPSSNRFTTIGEKIFDTSNYGGFKLLCRSMWPSIFYNLGFNLIERDIIVFFEKLLTEVFESRQYKESSRNDFVDFLLNWNKKKYLNGDSISNMSTGAKEMVNIDVDNNLLIGQCIMFFGAGFETTSTTINFLLFELAKNKDAQSRVIQEVDDYYQRHDKIEYESVNEMPFLQACLNESQRLYPVLGVITREAAGLRLEKGTRIHVPIYYLHHNPEYFLKPEEFRPERFLGDERKNIKPFTYMPFGEGPRICIGLRFGKMLLVAAILTIFKKYSIELAEGMPRKLDFQPRSFATQANCGINIKFIPREA